MALNQYLYLEMVKKRVIPCHAYVLVIAVLEKTSKKFFKLIQGHLDYNKSVKNWSEMFKEYWSSQLFLKTQQFGIKFHKEKCVELAVFTVKGTLKMQRSIFEDLVRLHWSGSLSIEEKAVIRSTGILKLSNSIFTAHIITEMGMKLQGTVSLYETWNLPICARIA